MYPHAPRAHFLGYVPPPPTPYVKKWHALSWVWEGVANEKDRNSKVIF